MEKKNRAVTFGVRATRLWNAVPNSLIKED